MKNFVRWWLPVIVWMGVIFAGSSIGNLPHVGGKTTDGIIHRLAHVTEFAILGALVLRGMCRGKPSTRREVLIMLLIVGLYGASDEFHQRFTPGRNSEGLTVLFDIAGGALGAWIYGWWRQQRARLAHQRRSPE